MKKLVLLLLMLLFSTPVFANNLPPGFTYRVLNNTPGTWQTFSFTFTPTQTGTQYIMFAFRQDPAYWRMDNVTVTAPGSSTNLITNGNMNTGGSLSVNTANYGQMTINAPTAWGISYQAGIYPAAAGTWMNGLWYDGAVGSYDGIYQGLNLTAGVTYTVTFQVNGDNTATTTTSGWQLAVYTGSCDQTTLDPSQCQIPTTSGFQTVAEPSATYSTGCGNSCPVPPSTEPTYPAATISTSQQNKIDQTLSITNNSIYIESYGDYNNVYVEQKSNMNSVRGINGAQYMLINGSNNTITINQGSTVTLAGQNLAEISIVGSNNVLNLTQEHNKKYAELAINGLGNNITLLQQDNGGKSAFFNVNSGSNTINVTQKGSGNHFFDLTAPHGGANVSVTQDGSAQKLFNLILNSSNIGVTVIQNNSTITDSATMSITCSTPPCTGYTYTKN